MTAYWASTIKAIRIRSVHRVAHCPPACLDFHHDVCRWIRTHQFEIQWRVGPLSIQDWPRDFLAISLTSKPAPSSSGLRILRTSLLSLWFPGTCVNSLPRVTKGPDHLRYPFGRGRRTGKKINSGYVNSNHHRSPGQAKRVTLWPFPVADSPMPTRQEGMPQRPRGPWEVGGATRGPGPRCPILRARGCGKIRARKGTWSSRSRFYPSIVPRSSWGRSR